MTRVELKLAIGIAISCLFLSLAWYVVLFEILREEVLQAQRDDFFKPQVERHEGVKAEYLVELGISYPEVQKFVLDEVLKEKVFLVGPILESNLIYVKKTGNLHLALMKPTRIKELLLRLAGKTIFIVLTLMSLVVVILMSFARKALEPINQLHRIIEDMTVGKYTLPTDFDSHGYWPEIKSDLEHLCADLKVTRANVDTHEGLKNSQYFHTEFERHLSLLERSQAAFGVVLLDFTKNDFWRHFGDQEIEKSVISLSQDVKIHLRQSDYLFRYGKYSFVMLLQNPNLDDLKLFSQKVIHVAEKKLIDHRYKMRCYASGVLISECLENIAQTKEVIIKQLERNIQTASHHKSKEPFRVTSVLLKIAS